MHKANRCVSCGRRIEYAGRGKGSLPDHHCSVRHEAALEAAGREPELPEPRERSFAERLEEGFAMLGPHYELLAPEDQIISAEC